MRSWRFYRHMPVYSSDGHRLGRTQEIGHDVEVIHIQQGHVLIRDWYVPISAVAALTERSVKLNVDMSQLRSNGWNVPPMEFLAHQGATPGYEYTSAADISEYGARPGDTERT